MASQKFCEHFIDFNADTSSLNKGESLEETFLTLYHQGVDLCILRTKNSHELVQFKNPLPLKLINGGDGVNEHPSQALLDLFTLKELSNNLEGKTLSLFGDLVHSRVGHSLIKLLPQFGIKIILCGPREFLPNHDELNSNIQLTTNRDEALKKSDFIYLLRIQKERHKNLKIASDEEYHHNYGVTLELLQKLKKTSPVFHPGPANIGVEIDRNLMKSSLYQGYKQVENSLPVRMAIIQSMLLNTVTSFGKTHGEIVQSNA